MAKACNGSMSNVAYLALNRPQQPSNGMQRTTGVRAAASLTTHPPQAAMRAFHRDRSVATALAELAAQARGPKTPTDGKVRNAGKTSVSLGALIPVAGPYLIYRSPLHNGTEKYKLAWLSIALTGLVALSLVLQLRGSDTFEPGMRRKLDSDFNALGAVAEQYRLEHGDFADVATWQRLTRGEHPNFNDPWGRPYQYERTVDGVTIRTLGRDGINGGAGMDADLSAHFSAAGE
jgi:general secretion pathway protein G